MTYARLTWRMRWRMWRRERSYRERGGYISSFFAYLGWRYLFGVVIMLIVGLVNLIMKVMP